MEIGIALVSVAQVSFIYQWKEVEMKKALTILLFVVMLFSLSGVVSAQTELSMWYHGGAWAAEHQVFIDLIEAFNTSQSEYTVVLEAFPQESYNSSIVAAAAAGELPDIIDVDGPVMPGWAWAGWMAPLELSEGALDNFLPGPIGEWNGELYAVGLWDAAVSIYARRSVLDAYDIRIPTLEDPWTATNLTPFWSSCKRPATSSMRSIWAWLGPGNGIPTLSRPSCRVSAAT